MSALPGPHIPSILISNGFKTLEGWLLPFLFSLFPFGWFLACRLVLWQDECSTFLSVWLSGFLRFPLFHALCYFVMLLVLCYLSCQVEEPQIGDCVNQGSTAFVCWQASYLSFLWHLLSFSWDLVLNIPHKIWINCNKYLANLAIFLKSKFDWFSSKWVTNLRHSSFLLTQPFPTP